MMTDVTMETYYHSHQSTLIGRRIKYSCSIRIFALTFLLDFQRRVGYGHNPYTRKNQGRSSDGSR